MEVITGVETGLLHVDIVPVVAMTIVAVPLPVTMSTTLATASVAIDPLLVADPVDLLSIPTHLLVVGILTTVMALLLVAATTMIPTWPTGTIGELARRLGVMEGIMRSARATGDRLF